MAFTLMDGRCFLNSISAHSLARMEGEDDNGWQQVADALGVA